MFTRSTPYTKTKDGWKKLLYKYSYSHGLVAQEYRDRFIRVCDYPYDNTKKHYLILPINPDKLMFSLVELHEIETERSQKGYMCIYNSIKEQSCKDIYHKHLLLF